MPTLLEQLILRVGVLLGGVPGYTVTRSPQHLIEESRLPAITYQLMSCVINEDLEFNVINWVAELEFNVLLKTRSLDSEAQLIAAYSQIHSLIFGDRHLTGGGITDNGAYIYTGGIQSIEHDDTGAQTISRLQTTWTIEFRTNEQDLTQ